MNLCTDDDIMSGSFQDSYVGALNGNLPANNNPTAHSRPIKRPRVADDMDSFGDMSGRARTFMPIRGGSDIFSTEEWKPTGTSLFTPVKQDLYINVSKYDQVSAAQGSFFTADDDGNFHRSLVGHVIHLWRYDKSQKKQYIAQSFLFTNHQEFLRVQSFLQHM